MLRTKVTRTKVKVTGAFGHSATAVTGTMAKQKIVFLHPDLGIGGAERLVINAAMELSRLGYEARVISGRPQSLTYQLRGPTARTYQVVIYTTFHDVQRCFEETLSAGELAVSVEEHKRS